MNNHRPVPLLGQKPSREAIQAEILQRIDRLSQEIYSRLVVGYLSEPGELGPADPDVLKGMAGVSRAAAKVYYESLGIRFE